jgi:pyruvate-formate lyase-activating enzyme
MDYPQHQRFGSVTDINTDNLCGLLWGSLCNEPGGSVRSCCISRDKLIDNNGKEFNIATTNPLDILKSDQAKQLRQELLAGRKPSQCDTCWIDEDNGKESKRQIYNGFFDQWYKNQNTTWAENIQEDNIKLIDIQLIFGNTCNLKCRSCNPNYSSKWVEESHDRNFGEQFGISSDAMDMNDPQSKFWTDFDEWTANLGRIEIMGGEPFYVKEFRNFINNLVESGRSKHIEISLSTNGTILDKDFLETIIRNFREVAFSVSIDGIEDKFEYLRHPACWNEVKQNLDYFYKIHTDDAYPVVIQLTHTVTALNISSLVEFHKYFERHYPEFHIWNNVAHYPKWLTPSVLPINAKQSITESVNSYQFKNKSEIDSIINYMNTELYTGDTAPHETVEVKWQTFKEQTVGADRYREEDFRETFSELWSLIKHDFDYNSIMENISNNGYPSYGPGEFS